MQWMVSINELGAQQARILDDVSTDMSKTGLLDMQERARRW